MADNTQAPAAGSSTPTYLVQGNAAMSAGNYSHALTLFKQALHQAPALAKVIEFNIALAERKLGIASNKNISMHSSQTTYVSLKSNSENLEAIVNEPIAIKTIPVYEGRLEKNDQGMLRGWAVNTRKPADIFELSVLVDDVFFCKVKNHDNRADLQRAGKSAGRGGYSLVIPRDILDADAHTVSITYPDGSVLATVTLKGVTNSAVDDIVLLPVDEKVSVIVPIYNAVDDVKVCIERLIKYTNKDVDIILINDASPDKAINLLLEDAAKQSNFRVYHNEKNLGFTKTVNRGIELAGTNDVILLNSDARVTPRWIQGFKRALATDHKIATVTAMSDRAGAFSAPNIGNDNDLPAGIKEEEYAVAFRRRAVGYYPTVPTGNGFCMYIRRSCINEIGGLDAEAFPRGYGEENDFCMRARAAGWRNVIDDRTYVFHDRSKSFGGQKDELIKAGRAVVDSRYPDYKKATSIFSESPLINLARFKARHAIHDCHEQILPRGLFVISTLTGGTPQTNRDLMLALADRVEGWLLHCDRKVMSLYRVYKDKPDKLIRQHILKEQVEVLTHYCAEYDRVISNWLFEYDFEFVHIRHLAWHSLSLPKLAKFAGAKVINSFHDFYTLCPTVKLIDGDDKYCDGNCTKASSNACKPDLWGKDSLPTLKNAWVKTWREKFSRALSYCDVFITTHDSVRKTILEHLAIPAEKFHVIPHGRDFDKFYQLAEPYKNGEVLKILVPGNVSVPKGSKIIEQLLECDKEGKLHFHILGRSNIKFNHPRLTFHGEYKRDDFAEHVKKIRPHIGAVFSIWNETWCHTLTELWSVGLPVIVTEYETLKTRMADSDAGYTISSDLINSYSQIRQIADNEFDIQVRVKKTLEYQISLEQQTTYHMADQYHRVYFEY